MSEPGNKEVFAANLKFYLGKSGKDRNQICDELGFPYSTLSEWISGKKYPRIDKIELLAKYFGIEKSDLIEQRKEKEKSLEAIWAEQAPVLRRAGTIATPEERQRIANIIKATLGIDDK